jgi:hypothetical protein
MKNSYRKEINDLCPSCIFSLLSFNNKTDRNYFIKSAIVIVFIALNIIFADKAYGERRVKVATIGNTPKVIESDNKQEIVDHVLQFWDQELKQVTRSKPDLIVLPEFCDLSSLGEAYLNVRRNQVLEYFSSIAKAHRCYLAFGMQREDEKGYWRNSCVLIGRDGRIAGIYDKNFPTIGEMETGIKPGNEAPIIECDFGRVAIAICFDLNFDELRTRYAKENPDLIIFSSMFHGGVVQKLWAYTCQSYFVSSVYRGYPSEIRDPLGEVIESTTHNYDYAVTSINLDFKRVHLAYNLLNLTALKGKYGKSVRISDPGEYASVLVTSENSDVSAEQMIEEFNIEPFDDYLDRSREFKFEEGNQD